MSNCKVLLIKGVISSTFICMNEFCFQTKSVLFIRMVNIPKLRKTYCPHEKCKSHKLFKVTQFKKSAESKDAQGRRR